MSLFSPSSPLIPCSPPPTQPEPSPESAVPSIQQPPLDCNPLHGQTFDHVLEKIKQGMQAARGGGWVDIHSDSGDELELTPATTSHPATPGRHDDEPDEEEEELTDSSSLSLRLLPQLHQSTSPPSSAPLYPSIHPIPSQPIHHSDTRNPAHHSTLNTPTSPFGPITPPPANGSFPNPPSPYVRHHFKWEFQQKNPASLDPSLSSGNSQQPRLIETSSSPHNPTTPWNHDQQQPLKGLLVNHHPHQMIDLSPSANSNALTDLRSSTTHRSPVYMRWDIPSNRLPNGHDRTSELSRAVHNQQQVDQYSKFDNYESCFGSPSPTGVTTTRVPQSEPFNTSSISSVSFSLAPTAGAVRLTAPVKTSSTDQAIKPINNPDRESIRVSLMPPLTGSTNKPTFNSTENHLFSSSPTTASAPTQTFASQPPPGPLSPSSLSGLFQNMRIHPTQQPFPTGPPPPFYATNGTTSPLVGFSGGSSGLQSIPALHYQTPKPIIGLTPSVTAPLPGQVQPEEARKSVKTQPPVVNTGNSGAMVPQPGDWMCMCGFVNWRRRKVCMRCFPFADGNDSVGAMMAMNAQRAALLAAGGTLPDHNPQPLPNPNNTTIDTSSIHQQQQQQHSNLHQIFGPPNSAGPDGLRRRNPFDNSIPVVNEMNNSKEEWEELEMGTAARRRSCSLGAYSAVWDSSAISGGDGKLTAGLEASYPGSAGIRTNGIGQDNMNNGLSAPPTNSNRQRTATSPGSSWQAIRALWQ